MLKENEKNKYLISSIGICIYYNSMRKKIILKELLKYNINIKYIL